MFAFYRIKFDKKLHINNQGNFTMKNIIKFIAVTGLLVILNISPAFSRSWHIHIKDFSYQPDDVTIQVGDIIEWANHDVAVHTVTSDEGIFDSGGLQQNQSYFYTFTEIGDFPYHCTPHPYMTAVIHVRDADVVPELMNQTLPPYLPAEGGTLEFMIGVENMSTSSQNFDIWTNIVLPNGTVYGPLINGNFTIGGGANPSRDRTQVIPASAPEGDYFYHVFVGNYPDEVWSQDYFEFHKLPGTFSSSLAKIEFPIDQKELDFVDPGCVDSGCAEVKSDKARVSAYPNPFNPQTNLSFELPENSQISLKVYNSNGRLVEDIASGVYSVGLHEFNFNGEQFSSGIYFVHFIVNGELSTKSIMLLK